MGRSGGKPWTTPAEADWLRAKLSTFDNIKRTSGKKGLAKFWKSATKDFIAQFRRGANLEGEDLERLVTRLRQWFFNHTRVAGGTGWRRVINLNAKHARRLTAAHAYSNLYYKSKISAVVEKKWKERPDYEEDSVIPLWFKNRTTGELWKEESEEVRAEVKQYIEDEFSERMSKINGEEEISEDEDGDGSDLDEEEEARRKFVRLRQS